MIIRSVRRGLVHRPRSSNRQSRTLTTIIWITSGIRLVQILDLSSSRQSRTSRTTSHRLPALLPLWTLHQFITIITITTTVHSLNPRTPRHWATHRSVQLQRYCNRNKLIFMRKLSFIVDRRSLCLRLRMRTTRLVLFRRQLTTEIAVRYEEKLESKLRILD